jgi:hypothetical protein
VFSSFFGFQSDLDLGIRVVVRSPAGGGDGGYEGVGKALSVVVIESFFFLFFFLVLLVT